MRCARCAQQYVAMRAAVRQCGSVRRCGSAAVDGSAHGCLQQCTRMCAAVHLPCVAVHLLCAAARAVVCGSACSSGQLFGSVQQCAALCGSVRLSESPAVCNIVRQCAYPQINSKYVCINLYKFGAILNKIK